MGSRPPSVSNKVLLQLPCKHQPEHAGLSEGSTLEGGKIICHYIALRPEKQAKQSDLGEDGSESARNARELLRRGQRGDRLLKRVSETTFAL